MKYYCEDVGLIPLCTATGRAVSTRAWTSISRWHFRQLPIMRQEGGGAAHKR